MPQPIGDDVPTLNTEKYEIVKGKITPDGWRLLDTDKRSGGWI